MEKIRTGIIGCGKIAKTHANCLSQLPESEFTAVYNRNKERGEAFASKYKVKLYTNLDEMLRIHQDNIVSIFICGSAAGADYLPGVSNITLLIIL